MSVLLGCVADDFTGATDLANTLVRKGMRAVQLFGVPGPGVAVPDADAVIVALKSRTAPVGEAVKDSLAALDWLRRAGARQFFFKYCSTFDSTKEGNIGPVAEALMEALETDFTIYCPAFPETGRTICHGYLFVGDVLLSESGMKDHPLTPMTDANLARWLGHQTQHPVGIIPHSVVDQGPAAITGAIHRLRRAGTRHAVVDALTDRHLNAIGFACADLTLVTGGSGVALGLPENFRRQGLLPLRKADELPKIEGLAAVLAGSCSQATLGQIAHMKERQPAFRIEPEALARGEDAVGQALAFARPKLADGPVLIYASAAPEEVRRAQAALGRERAGALVEEAMAAVARGLVEAGVRRLVVAGGETSGAVVQALKVDGIRIGPQIDPGVPWTAAEGGKPMLLALKSGNFGAPDFFTKCFAMLEEVQQ